jgi:hypothetical protein
MGSCQCQLALYFAKTLAVDFQLTQQLIAVRRCFIDGATRRMIAIIYEPESSESADEMQPDQKSPDHRSSHHGQY